MGPGAPGDSRTCVQRPAARDAGLLSAQARGKGRATARRRHDEKRTPARRDAKTEAARTPADAGSQGTPRGGAETSSSGAARACGRRKQRERAPKQTDRHWRLRRAPARARASAPRVPVPVLPCSAARHAGAASARAAGGDGATKGGLCLQASGSKAAPKGPGRAANAAPRGAHLLQRGGDGGGECAPRRTAPWDVQVAAEGPPPGSKASRSAKTCPKSGANATECDTGSDKCDSSIPARLAVQKPS